MFFPEVKKDTLQEFKLEMHAPYHLLWHLAPHRMRKAFARTREDYPQNKQTFMHMLWGGDSAWNVKYRLE